MKKLTIIMISVLSPIIILGVIFGAVLFSRYNTAIALRETANQKQVAIGVVQQSRYEKMTSLIDALTNLQEHVESQLQLITNARVAYVNALSSGNLEQMEEAENNLEQEFIALQVIIEDNPDTFIATSAYLGYMNEISMTNNVVNNTRLSYNQKVEEYNTFSLAFPNNIILRWFKLPVSLEYYAAPSHTAGTPSIG